MDWFRSWHGAATDPKWLVIARRAQVPPGMVSALAWALLDYASQHADRGSVDNFDIETYAAFTGWEEDQIEAIISAMRSKGIVTPDNRLASWEKRQPKREDPTATERQQKRRASQRDVTVSNADVTQDNAVVTQRHATSHTVTTDREIREDKDTERDISQSAAQAPSANADILPVSLAGWSERLKDSKNRSAELLTMFNALYPNAVDVPSFAYLGKAASTVGGVGRLAELLWQHSAKPPSGDVLAYIMRSAKNGTGRNGPDPKRMAETQTDYKALKARYAPDHLDDLIEH